MAVKHSKVKDEPIKDLLGNINTKLIQLLLERRYGGDASRVPTVDYLAKPSLTSTALPASVRISKVGITTTYQFGSVLPDATSWLEVLAGPSLSWLRALISSSTIVQGSLYLDNPIRRLLVPRAGQKVVVASDGDIPSSVSVFGAARSHGVHDEKFKAVEIVYDASSRVINLTLFEERLGSALPLLLQFQYSPSNGSAPIHEIATGRNDRIKEFYWKLWYGDTATLPRLAIQDTFTGPEVVIDADTVERFCAVVGNQTESFQRTRVDGVSPPMDFAIVTGWQVRLNRSVPRDPLISP